MGTADNRAVESVRKGRRWGTGGGGTPAHVGVRNVHGQSFTPSAISSWGCRKPESFRRCREWSGQSLTAQRA